MNRAVFSMGDRCTNYPSLSPRPMSPCPALPFSLSACLFSVHCLYSRLLIIPLCHSLCVCVSYFQSIGVCVCVCSSQPVCVMLSVCGILSPRVRRPYRVQLHSRHCTRTRTRTHTHLHTHTYAHTHTYTHTYTHTRTHTYTHTRTLTHTQGVFIVLPRAVDRW